MRLCAFFSTAFTLSRTWVNDGVLLIEGNPGVPPFPLRPLDFQVALFDGQQGNALVVSCVELCQVLVGHRQEKKNVF